MKRFILPLSIFIILVLFLAAGLRSNPQEIPSPFIGKPAPQFELSQLEEQQKSFSPQDMRGKVWLLNVWASWCGSCRNEHPVLLNLAESGVAPIVGLNYKDARDDGRKWLSRFGNPYHLSVLDMDGKVGIDYGVYGLPETFVVDKQGIIRLKHTGPVTEDVLKNKLLPLIERLNAA